MSDALPPFVQRLRSCSIEAADLLELPAEVEADLHQRLAEMDRARSAAWASGCNYVIH